VLIKQQAIKRTFLLYYSCLTTLTQVDNIAAVFGWQNRQVKEDTAASIFIRCLHLISTSLPCRIHVQHLPRLSSEAGTLADHLSRRESTSASEEAWASRVEKKPVSGALTRWLEDPSEDWDLANRILADITGYM